jgi:hypothetical protein
VKRVRIQQKGAVITKDSIKVWLDKEDITDAVTAIEIEPIHPSSKTVLVNLTMLVEELDIEGELAEGADD